ncbi:MAG: hypothetical protein HYY04_16385 [Chloroflexi bacterium]|nr:hypothetical protein [Chloroflexota bacterium]
MAELARVTSEDGCVELRNGFWALRVGVEPWLNPGYLFDITHGVPVADDTYAYELRLAPLDDLRYGEVGAAGRAAPEASAHRVRCRDWAAADLPEGGKEVRFTGRFDFARRGPTDVEVEHTFRLPDAEPWIEEQIHLVHRFGQDAHQIRHLRFGFRKMIYDRDRQAWLGGSDRHSIIAVPHRRRCGQLVDHIASAYPMSDLIFGRFAADPWEGAAQPPWLTGGTPLPGRGAEAWVWTDGQTGYLIAKYSPDQIEFAIAEGEMVRPASQRSDPTETFNPPIAGWLRGGSVCFRFGGVGRRHGCPEASRAIGAAAAIPFGITRIYPVEGDWPEGYRTYKRFLVEKGHGCPADFDPPVYWNQIYNTGWPVGDNAPLQEPAEILAEAAIARDVGAEALYYDTGWDTYQGSSVWDEARFGPIEDFVRILRERYGLKLALDAFFHSKKLDEDPRVFRRRTDGSVDIYPRDYRHGRVCAASPAWQQQETDRLLQLLEAGVVGFTLSSVNYLPPWAGAKSTSDPGSPCMSLEHGHGTPLTMRSHAEAILAVVRVVKQRFAHALFQIQDRVTGGTMDFHPLYFQHAARDSFDAHWGFEYMWDPYMDLLSGRALSLYEYNLAYDIPAYLHFDCGCDNEQMLAFWWYASTCRHIGIGGVKDPASPIYRALKRAMSTYRRLKPFFARGRFVGVDPLVHGHALPEENAAVFVLFNLGAEPVVREVDVPLADLGLTTLRSAHHAEVRLVGERLAFAVELPPLSPLVIELNTIFPQYWGPGSGTAAGA